MTNPDNAGGLPATGPFVDRLIRIFRDKPHDDTSALVLLEYGELCRAAPAGGDGDWYTSDQGSHIVDFDQDSANQLSILLKRDGTVSAVTTRDGKRSVGGYGLDEVADVIRQWSAPAGSGEVDLMVRQLDERAKWFREENGYDATLLRQCAALLRKLQQGAESFVSCTCHEERQKALCLNKHRCVRAYPLASQGQEGGNNA
jgi:hypothetical protein